jgi:hypothetical protein
MRRTFFVLGMMIVGAAALAPAIAYIGLEPMPGDFIINQGAWHLAVPVTYSLCASMGLGLLYYVMRR